MPDGELSPEQQINTEVTLDQSLRALGAAFGTNADAKLGGGTSNGSWVFTDLNELDQVIQQWIDIKNELVTRARRIADARANVRPPAEDVMSGFQATAFQQSLQVLQQHTVDMAAYANEYARKLQDARTGYSTDEQAIAAKLNGAHG
jgi:hypothetical protein